MIFYSSKIPELQSAVKKRQYDERWDHVCNAAELAVVSFLLGRRICFSGGQSASVVDQQPHDVRVVDNRRQLQRSYVVLNRPFLTVRLHEILSEPSSSVNMFVVVVHLSLVFADFSCVKEWENYRRALHRAHWAHSSYTGTATPNGVIRSSSGLLDLEYSQQLSTEILSQKLSNLQFHQKKRNPNMRSADPDSGLWSKSLASSLPWPESYTTRKFHRSTSTTSWYILLINHTSHIDALYISSHTPLAQPPIDYYNSSRVTRMATSILCRMA